MVFEMGAAMTNAERVETIMQLIEELGSYPAKAMRSFNKLPFEARDIVANKLLQGLSAELQATIMERFGVIEAKWFSWDLYNAISESAK